MTNAVAFTKTGTSPMTFAGTVSSTGVQIRATEGTLNFVGSNRFTSATDPALFIGSATTSARVSFGNDTTVGAESFTGISVLGTGSSLVSNGSALYTISMQNGGTNDWRNLTIGGAGTNENNLSVEAFSGGTLQFGSANTYAGRNNLGRSTWEVSVLANAGQPSSIGTGALVPTIDMHDTTSTAAVVSTLRYVGTTNASTDRAIRFITDGTTMLSLTGAVENNGTGTLKFTSAFTATGNTTLPRTLRLSGSNMGVNEIVSMTDGPSSIVTLDKAGAGRWALTGGSTYTGGTTISAGTLQLGKGGTAGMVGSGDIAIAAGAILATNRSNTLTIANNITGAGGINIANATNGSTVLSSSANNFSGGTIVSSGMLVVTNASGSATGSGSVFVDTPAMLAGSGRIAPAANTSILISGTLSVGVSNTTATDLEIVTSGAGTLRMEGSSAMVFDLLTGAGLGNNASIGTAADLLIVSGLLTLETGSTLRVQNPNAMTSFALGDAWRLFDWSTLGGTASGTFTNLDLPTLSSGLVWDMSQLYTAGTVAVVPEPSRVLLLVAGLVCCGLRRKRTHAVC
jgi:autotransporter-associated beta strand protein